MRRSEKAITEKQALESVIKRSAVCRLGLSDGRKPYVVPVCFGYDGKALYIHGSLQGKKIDILQKNPNVCVEFDVDANVREKENACRWSMAYQSVIAFGRASFVETLPEKKAALDIIMGQYSEAAHAMDEHAVRKTAVIRIDITEMTGKQSGYVNGQKKT